MNETKRDFSKVPATAFTCASGAVELAEGRSGNKGKTSPVRLKARSGQPIDHPYWGRIVHDLSGMRMHKNRLPIDYAHNHAEVLGYVNKFDTTSGDLFASGAMTPFSDNDRASEVLFKMREGVPYEASIFFGGDGIKVQEVGDGEVAEVNGYELSGPAVIVREWPLRGIAICPYGADMHTESAVNFANGKEFAVTIIEKKTKETEMSESTNESVVEEAVVEVGSPQVADTTEAVESADNEAVEAESVAIEAAPVEPEASPEETPEEPQPEHEAKQEATVDEPMPEQAEKLMSVKEFSAIADEFGDEIAAATFKAGGTYRDAEVRFYKILRDKNEELESEVERLRTELASKGGIPAAFAPNETHKKTSCLFKTGK